MEKIKQFVPKIAILLAGILFGIIVQQSCIPEVVIGSKSNDSEFVENLSNYDQEGSKMEKCECCGCKAPCECKCCCK